MSEPVEPSDGFHLFEEFLENGNLENITAESIAEVAPVVLIGDFVESGRPPNENNGQKQ